MIYLLDTILLVCLIQISATIDNENNSDAYFRNLASSAETETAAAAAEPVSGNPDSTIKHKVFFLIVDCGAPVECTWSAR